MHFAVMISLPPSVRPYIKEAASSTYHSHQRTVATCKHDAASRARLSIRCFDISHEPETDNTVVAAGGQIRATESNRLHRGARLAQLEHVASAVNTISQ